MTQVCGTGTWGTAPKPGDPDNNSILTAKPAFGGIDVMWSFPEVNPHGVAYVNLYRGTSDEVAYAVRHAVVTGDFFYDKTTTATPIEYFYWIEIVSVNGTHGELIGPASAIARPTIEQVMDGLTSQIDVGMLSQSLKQQLDRIELTDQRISEEILERARSIATLGDSIELIQLEVDGAVSAINEETAQRQDAHDAFVGQLNQMYATLDGSITAAIQEEQLARATEDEALATQIQTLSAQTADDLSAAIQSERQAWTSANEALSGQVDTLFTSLDDKFTAAIQDEQTARISANEAIAESLNTLTTVSSDNAAAIEEERQARVSADTAIVESIDTLYSTVGDDIEAAVQSERTARTESQSAMATSFEALVAQTAEDLNAAIQTESTARSDAVEAVTTQITTLESRVNDDVFAAINTEQQARIDGHEALSTEITSLGTKFEDDLSAAIQSEQTARTTADDALAAAIQTAQAELGDDIATARTQLETMVGDTVGAMWTAQVDVNGMVGGFGIMNDGQQVEAGFDVDRFWVGKSGDNKRKPFIIENNETFIDEAAINKLTFNKLRDASGNFVVDSNGKIKASYIDANNLSVKESATFIGTAQSSNFINNAAGWQLTPTGGQINFPIRFSNVTGAGALAGKDSVNWESDIQGSGKPNTVQRKTNNFDDKDSFGNFLLAVCPGGRATARFRVWEEINGRHNAVEFSLSAAYGNTQRATFSLHSASRFGNRTITRVGLACKDTYDPMYVFVSLSDLSGNNRDFHVEVLDNGPSPGWIVAPDRWVDTTGHTVRSWTVSENLVSAPAQWVRPNSTLIDGNKIYTGDAYVDTLQIKGNAVTIPGSSATHGTTTNSIRSPGASNLWWEVQRLTFRSSGNPVAIWMQARARGRAVEGDRYTNNASTQVRLRFKVDGSVSYTTGYIATGNLAGGEWSDPIMWIDRRTLSAGNHTFTIEIGGQTYGAWTSGKTPPMHYFDAASRVIIALETKR